MTKGLIIYNVGLIQPEQLDKLLESANLLNTPGADPGRDLIINEFLTLVKKYNDASDVSLRRALYGEIAAKIQGTQKDMDDSSSEAQEIIKIRQFIQENTKKYSDISLVLYSTKNDRSGTKETNYVIDSVRQAAPDLKNPIDLLYLGGGHGGWNMTEPYPGLVSGLSKESVTEIIEIIGEKEVNAIVLGSCFSAAHATSFQKLLTPEGVMLSSTVSQADDNYYTSCADVLLGKKSTAHFLDSDPLDSAEKGGIIMDIIQTDLGVALGGRPTLEEIQALQTELSNWQGEPLSTCAALASTPIVNKIREGLGESVLLIDPAELDQLARCIKSFCQETKYVPGTELYGTDDLAEYIKRDDPSLSKYLPVLAFMEDCECTMSEDYKPDEHSLDDITVDINTKQLTYWASVAGCYQKALSVDEVDTAISSVLLKIKDVLEDRTLTGQCVSTANEHVALKLNEKTGKPVSAGSDEYQMNNRIIDSIDASQSTLETCNRITQANLFNRLIASALPLALNEDEFDIEEVYKPDEILPQAIIEKKEGDAVMVDKFKEAKEKYLKEIKPEELQHSTPQKGY